MLVTSRERRLCQILKTFPKDHEYRYTASARKSLLRALFKSLVGDKEDYIQALFRGRIPESGEAWSLSKVQGMTEDMEYTEVARGKPCGHIYKSGDAVYRCKTCSIDETCVLCTRCFEASDHTGHVISQSISLGNSGCCDCGDEEAWRVPLKCAIHMARESTTAAGKKAQRGALPDDLLESIRMTIGRAMDYMIDVISCSPENLRVARSEESIRRDEEQSRLGSVWYQEQKDTKPEYALVLWNDEKHTVTEVEAQVARACKKRRSFGREKANETNDVGRSVVEHSKEVPRLLNIAKIMEQIKITVTIRSSRDTFREQMCGTIIEWLGDISGCSVGENTDVLRQTICEELLKSWRLGSEASNKWIGKDGLDDHESEDHEENPTNILATLARREDLTRQMRMLQEELDSDDQANENENDDDDDEADSQANEEQDGIEQMDLDIMTVPDENRDLEMRTTGDLEDETEFSEATFAGYPPPPPPPPPLPPAARDHIRTYSTESEVGEPFGNFPFMSSANIEIPSTPSILRKKPQPRPPAYWLQRPERSTAKEPVPLHEDLRQRIRLDWLLLYDLRLWKKARIDLRDLYISTVVSIPRFKRVLGLRFAGLYSVLGQLYLIADREPDHSIINLSVQTFTTPSVTREVIERGNFLTTLFSMLYTFLTQREVQQPWQVSIDDALAFDHNSVANRRMYHFFNDLKHIFALEYVQEELREQERYTLQFLDLIRLPQGICPNVRAVGDHVEYESDIWISAQLLTKEINRLCRQFAETFYSCGDKKESNLIRVLRTVAKATIVNSIGGERARFNQAEIRRDTSFKTLESFFFERNIRHSVVDFVVEREPISFHHALHYTFSWLIDGGKSMSLERLKDVLHFAISELAHPPPFKALVPNLEPEDYLLAVFDFPLRVCAWLAQMKAGMWVRNGLSLRHQMTTYRGVSHRDLAHHRDIFLLQTAMVVCNPSRVLASMIDRFGMDDWMRGNYVIREGFEPSQQLDVAEDFIHLLIIMLCDRTSLQPLDSVVDAQALAIRRDIAHILCFKPLSFSELNNRFADKATDLEDFQDILEEMTIYRPPEGLSDTGSFELKKKWLGYIDPYTAHYTKNQRDEAENAYRMWIASNSRKPAADVVFEPNLMPIKSGIFTHLADFIKTPLFAQIIFCSLNLAFNHSTLPETPATRIEAYLHVTLHLLLTAVNEDEESDDDRYDSDTGTFEKSNVLTARVLRARSDLGHTIFETLVRLLENSDIRGCHAKIRLILHRIQGKEPLAYNRAVQTLYGESRHPPALPLERLGFESPITPLDNDLEAARQRQARQLKKQQALDRQAKVMAQFQQQQQNFLNNQDIEDWDCADEPEPIVAGAAEEHMKTWKYPTGNCILCQEETNDNRLYGTFALMMNSTIFRETEARDPDFLGEVLSTPDSLDRSADDIRPFGIAGQNRAKVTKRRLDGFEFESEHQGLAKGFPSEHSRRAPVSTGCGHIMHWSCFEVYCTATQRRQSHQIARQHPERLDLKEFVCPLCKALGNSFLPIIWKGKEEAYPGILQTEESFDEWLVKGVGLTGLMKSQEGYFRGRRLQEMLMSYASKSVISPIASRLSDLVQTPTTSPISPPSLHVSSAGILPFPFNEDNSLLMSPGPSPSPESLLVNELFQVYIRLRDTMKANKLPSIFRTLPDSIGEFKDLIHIDSLSQMLGYSIEAAEIAQRGVPSESGQTLVDKIPSAVMTHLRILSETASSYAALGGVRNSGNNLASTEYTNLIGGHLLHLFVGHPLFESSTLGQRAPDQVPAALLQDAFVLLAQCSVDVVPALNLEVHHVMHLCYIVEIVKVTLYLTAAPDSFETCITKMGPINHSSTPTAILQGVEDFIERLSTFSSRNRPIITYGAKDDESTETKPRSAEFYALLYHAISRYALVFQRKVAILFNIRYGVDFSETSYADMEASELDRLTRILRLPSLLDIFTSVSGHDHHTENAVLDSMIKGWIGCWQHNYDQKQLFQQNISALPLPELSNIPENFAHKILRPSHPAIFELIGLPKTFDSLTYEVTRRRCATKGGKMEDAALCLFCGAIFCGQALCCSKNNKGGCYQHMQRCGKDVGLFLNVRKCTILYLHNRNGSWNLAPYLDKYGEPDPGLRRGRQLFLNQKRYDALFRSVWLGQGIPTTIARKLEAEINNGGWETL